MSESIPYVNKVKLYNLFCLHFKMEEVKEACPIGKAFKISFLSLAYCIDNFIGHESYEARQRINSIAQ